MNIHVIKSHPTTISDHVKTPDILSSKTAAPSDVDDSRGPRHEQLCHTTNAIRLSDDLMDCLFDDIDYHDLFDSDPLPLDSVTIPHQQQHEGSCDHNERSCDHNEMSCDAIEIIDDSIIEIPADDDSNDIIDVSTVNCSKLF